ncbi:MAG: RHS repeat-associated core domain-containing protein [Parachlamydiales bacterium]|jgi:RHS repeat-associated protein
MKIFYLFAPLLFISTIASAFEAPSDIREHFPMSSVSDTDGITSTLIGGHFNAISGNFVDFETDILIEGPDPLALSRCYSNGDLSRRFLGASWDVTLPLTANVEGGSVNRKNVFFDIYLKEHSGGISHFRGQGHRTSKPPIGMTPETAFGYSNCGMGRPSGKSNPKNSNVSFKERDQLIDVIDGGGNHRSYFKDKGKEKGIYHLQFEKKANGTYFQYIFNSKEVLKSITRSFIRKENARIDFSKYKDQELSLQASNGQKVRYGFEELKVGKGEKSYHVPYLMSVEKSHGINNYYRYSRNEFSLLWNISEKISGPDENSTNFLKVHYFNIGDNANLDGSSQVDKKTFPQYSNHVKSLSNPHGILYNFFYSCPKVEVINSENHRKCFSSAGGQLNSITHYYGSGDYTPAYSENYTWEWGGQLKSKKEVEPTGHIIRSKDYIYDERGNIQQEILSGYLDGSFTPGSYSKRYTHSNDQFNNQLTQEDDEGPTIIQHYVVNSDLPCQKFVVCDGIIVLREFRFYNDQNLCWAETFDNGAGVDHDDLNNLTERLKVIRQFCEDPACFGKPQVESFFYWDRKTCQDTPLKTIRYTYDAVGQLTHTDLFDADGVHRYTLEKRYDCKGRVIWETDPLQNVTEKVYDPYGNIEFLCGPDKRWYSHFIYDQTNRLVSTRINVPEGTAYSTHRRYNNMDQITYDIDYLGQKIVYRYDGLDRVSEKYSPAYINNKGVCTLGTEFTKYNILGCPTSIENESGEIVYQRFTSRNTIAEKIYPDGSTEQWRYTPSGNLKSYTSREGTGLQYTYDRMGNKITECTLDVDGQILTKMSFEWKGKRLKRIEDNEGLVTTYDYDGAGRCIEECKATKRITYEYDSLGRVSRETTWELDSDTPLCILTNEYDLMDRVIGRCTLDGKENVIARESTTFDMCGREIINTHWAAEGESYSNYTTYDILGRPIHFEDALGRKTHIEYTTVQDPHNEGLLLLKSTTDQLGRTTSELHDPYGKVTKIEIKNSLGTLLSARTYAYDHAGRRTECKESIITAGEEVSEQIFLWKYDPAGNLTEEIRGYGTPDQHIITHRYAPGALRTDTIKPDGNILHRTYDNARRLLRIFDDKNTISYRYTYDSSGRVEKVEDEINHITQSRSYAKDNNIQEETLYDDVRVGYVFDPLCQLRKLVYPDGSCSEYHYTGTNLNKVIRKNAIQESMYDHSILERNFQKRPLKVKLAGNSGEVHYSYNPLGKVQSIQSPHFHQKIETKDPDDKPLSIRHQDTQEPWIERYGYNDLDYLCQEKGQTDAEYVYDSIGNRIIVKGRVWTYNQTNQLKATDELQFTYDLNGNQIDDGKKQFSYDALDRLIQVQDGENLYQYIYDDSNRRLKKRHINKSNSVSALIDEECYLYCNNDEIGTCTSKGQILQLRILADGIGGEIGASIAIEKDQEIFAVVHDQRGSIRSLISVETGELKALFRYDAFGKITHEEGSHSKCCLWRLNGKRMDPETGFSYFGCRYYDSDTGRWTTLDPIGFEGGSNGYTFVNNRPFCLIDIYGKYSQRTVPYYTPGYENHFTSSKFLSNESWFNFFEVCDTDEFCPRFPPSTCFNLDDTDYGKLGIGLTNGICTDMEYFKGNMDYFFNITGQKMMGAYNATFGFFEDGIECTYGVLGYSTDPVLKIHDMWDHYFDKAPSDGIFLTYCHSQGAINTANALKYYDQERCKRIHVVAIAPAKYISVKACGYIQHYVADWDIVANLDLFGRIMAEWQGTVKVLERQEWGLNHSFRCTTYAEAMRYEYYNLSKRLSK